MDLITVGVLCNVAFSKKIMLLLNGYSKWIASSKDRVRLSNITLSFHFRVKSIRSHANLLTSIF